MPPSSVRRFFPLIVPLILVLAACQGGPKQTPGETPSLELGEAASFEMGQAPSLAASSRECTEADLAVRPCSGEDAGAECAINGQPGGWIPWESPHVQVPPITFAYPCNPDGFRVGLAEAPPEADATLQQPAGTLDGQLGFAARGVENAVDLQFLFLGPLKNYDPNAGWPITIVGSLFLNRPGYRYVYFLSPFMDGDEYDDRRPWGMGFLWTGPMCTGLGSPPVAIDLKPVDGRIFNLPLPSWQDGRLLFTWRYGVLDDCLVEFQTQVSTDETFQSAMALSVSSPFARQGTLTLEDVETCQTYHWRVRARLHASKGGMPGPWSLSNSFRVLPEGGEEQCPQVDVGPSLGAPEAIVDKNAACRFGPSTLYGIASYVSAGERHPVEGRNAAGTWLKLKDLGCYVLGELLHLERDGTPVPDSDSDDLTLALAVLPDPPLPTESSLVCTSTLGPGECADAGGTYEYLTSPTGGPAGQRCNCP